IVIFSQLYIHLFMIILAITIIYIYGFSLDIHFVQIIYFLFSTVIFSYALALITSTLSTIIRDIHMLLNSSLRLLLYLSPVLWSLEDSGRMSESIKGLLRYNPLYYLIEGYRASFFGTSWYFIENIDLTIYFWILTLFILFL